MKISLGKNNLTPAEAARLCGGTLYGDSGIAEIHSVCTDSGEGNAETLFCAIRGERVDGHNYIAKAGCRCVLCERIPDNAGDGITFIKVCDTVEALAKLADGYSSGNRIRTVAVTGSVGKTTTKEFISSALPKDRTYKTKGNFNSVIGLPLSMLEIPENTGFAVLEMGMSRRGEIERMSLTAKPDIAVITNIGTSHLEMLGSRENIRAAKLEITAGLKPGGILLINGDDPMLAGYETGVRTLSVGIDSPGCDFRAVNLFTDGEQTTFEIISADGSVNVSIPVPGKHNVYAALFAYAAATLSGVEKNSIISGVASFEKPEMRQNIYEVNGITIIEDCYNACPESMRAALDVQHEMVKRRKGRAVALLGNMLELGDNTEELHRQVGRYAAECGVDALFTYGELAGCIADGAGIAKTVRLTDTKDPGKAAAVIMEMLKPNDILLVKASRALAAEKITEILKERL